MSATDAGAVSGVLLVPRLGVNVKTVGSWRKAVGGWRLATEAKANANCRACGGSGTERAFSGHSTPRYSVRLHRTAFFTVPALALSAGSALAQTAGTVPPPALTRTVLQQKPLSTPGREGVQVLAVLVAGGSSVRHTHPGEEFGYVLEGTATFELAGQPPLVLKPGDSFFIPVDTPHIAHNRSTTPLRLISTYIVETGRPLSTPAP